MVVVVVVLVISAAAGASNFLGTETVTVCSSVTFCADGLLKLFFKFLL